MGGHSNQYTKNVLVILSMNSKFFKYKLSCFPIPPKMQVLFIKKAYYDFIKSNCCLQNCIQLIAKLISSLSLLSLYMICI